MQFWWFDTAIQAALAVVCLTLSVYVFRLRHRLIQQQQLVEEHFGKLERELKALTSGAVGVGRKLLNVEQRLQQNEKKAQEFTGSDAAKVSYNEAARLLGLGADIDDLISNCGLSRPEAELVAALHRQRSSA